MEVSQGQARAITLAGRLKIEEGDEEMLNSIPE
jgi:hypothetical protein